MVMPPPASDMRLPAGGIADTLVSGLRWANLEWSASSTCCGP